MTFDPLDIAALTVCDDADLLATQAALVADRPALDARLAAVSAEIARRSAPDAGMAGLAQRFGDRTAARLIERTTGLGQDEARRLIEVGSRVRDPGDPVGTAVVAGELSVTSAAAITSELGRVVGDVSPELRRSAEADLVAAGATLAPSEIRREARAFRDALDVEGVPEREERLWQQRRLTLTKLETGMIRLEGLLDPESAALVSDAFDRVLSPRRGGPRFVDPADVARAEKIAGDPRSTEQMMADTLVGIVRVAARADDGELFGTSTPAVRVHVFADALGSEAGAAHLEGQAEPVSVATAERHTCAGSQAIRFDSSGAALDLGREQRLFSRAQRRALAARDGGCLVPGCDRPPSWTEAHHIDEWPRHGGRTDVGRGVLLCAHHHRWVHAHRHRVVRRGGEYGAVDGSTGVFTPWPSKSALHRPRRPGAREPARR